MEAKQKSLQVQQRQQNVPESDWKNKETNAELNHLQKQKTRDLTNHKESSACLCAKLDSARFSFADSATSSVISYS